MVPFNPKPEQEGINHSEQRSLWEYAKLLASGLTIILLIIGLFGISGEWILLRFGWLVERHVFSSSMLGDLGGKPFPKGKTILENLVGTEASQFQVHVICDDEPNAFAMPGLYIAVTSGALKQIHSETGLAFIIAHEYGHFQNQDHLRGLGFGLGVSAALSLIGMDQIGAWITNISGEVLSRQFSQAQEEAADSVAISLLLKKYGHLNGATELFDHLQEVAGDAPLDSIFSTHPLTASRIARIRATAQEQHNSKRLEFKFQEAKFCKKDPPEKPTES